MIENCWYKGKWVAKEKDGEGANLALEELDYSKTMVHMHAASNDHIDSKAWS